MPAACFAYIRLFNHYKSGYLWEEGGLASQPHVYLRVMEIINSEVSKIEQEQMEQSKQQANPGH